jgi:hypothetical protein
MPWTEEGALDLFTDHAPLSNRTCYPLSIGSAWCGPGEQTLLFVLKVVFRCVTAYLMLLACLRFWSVAAATSRQARWLPACTVRRIQ